MEFVDANSLFALQEGQHRRFHGPLVGAVGQLIDGQRSVGEIIAQLQQQYSAAEVHFALLFLEREGLILEAEGLEDRARLAFWHGLGLSARFGAERLEASPVELCCIGDVDPEPVQEALARSGVKLTKSGGALRIVLTDDYLREDLSQINRAALEAQSAWLLLKTRGHSPWLGPLFVPGQTACWECLAERLRSNRQVEAYLRARNSAGPSIYLSYAINHPAAGALAHLAAAASVAWLARGDNALAEQLVALDLSSLGTRPHVVVRRPQCVACGVPELLARRQQQPIQVESSLKAFTEDGGHRSLSPDETVRRHQHHVSPVTGLVACLEAVPSPLAELAPLFDSGHNMSRRSESAFFLEHHLRARSGGKGKTSTQARASALCEALERACGVFQGDESRERATLRQVGAEAVAPPACLLFSDAQYAGRVAWNAAHLNPSQRVPDPFDDRRAIDWSPAWSLTAKARRFIPTALAYYGYPHEPEHRFAWADSNGCAAGNSMAEAIMQGFLEVVERDAVALWWYNQTRVPGVDMDTFGDPYVARLREHYARINRDVWMLDITTDVGIPTFAAVSRQRQREERIALGFGAHLDAKLALLRALTEMNQFLPFIVTEGARMDLHDADVEAW
ncbi:MAG TPA: TOMM precursor leader peptide-binding protein, partial [Polyangiaceae bacterium]|nr:TOMM precursor leader peptide-binding protein [Polyangiaceae bacterium]